MTQYMHAEFELGFDQSTQTFNKYQYVVNKLLRISSDSHCPPSQLAHSLLTKAEDLERDYMTLKPQRETLPKIDTA